MRTLYEPYACCGGYKPIAAFTAKGGFDDLIRQLADDIYNSQNDRYYSPELVKETADELTDAISEGYGDIAADWDTPDHLMLEKLVENVFQF